MTALSEKLEHYVNTFMPTIHGWCDPFKARDIIKTVLEDKPVISVEIGVFAGRSLFAVGAALEEIGANGQVYGIDPWSSEACGQGYEKDDPNKEWWDSVNMGAIERSVYDVRSYLNLTHRVQLLKAKAVSAYPRFQEWHKKDSPIDFLHIDGNHSEETSSADVELYLPLVRSGATVFMDDTNWESTKKAQRMLLEFCEEPRIEESESHCYGVYKKK